MTGRLGPLALRPRHARRPLPLDDVPTSVVRVGATWVRVHRLGADAAGAAAGGPVFVLLHGIGVSSRYFVPLAEELAAHGAVYLLDLPGFAGLPRPGRPLGVADFAAVVAAVLDARGVTDAVLVGHSMGSQVVTELLATRPDLTAGAVLVGPIIDLTARGAGRQLVRFVRSTSYEPWRVRGIAARAYVACGVRWFLDVLPAMLRYPTEERLIGVAVPVVLVRGEHDVVSPPSWLGLLAERVTGTANTYRTVPGAAHSVIFDHADEVARAVLDVLAASRVTVP